MTLIGNTRLRHRKDVSFCIICLLLFLFTACRSGIDKTLPPDTIQDSAGRTLLVNARSSINDLCREVLDRVARNDRHALEALALTEDEIKRYVWPYEKHSRSEVNMPFDFWWGELRKKSSFRLTQTLQKFGGKKFELISVRFAEEAMQYNNATVHRDSRITVRNEEGQESVVEMFGSVFELNGQYKIFSYIYK
jgi:hypothetical protein